MARLEAIEYLPPQDENELGDPVGPALAAVAIPGCKVWPRTSTETGTEVIIDGLGVKTPARLPAGLTEIKATGRVKARGKTWEIDGVPGLFSGKGYLLYLKRVGS